MTTQNTSADTLDLKVLLKSLTAYRNGDFTVRMPEDLTGISGKVADTLNAIIDMTVDKAAEYERIANIVGKQGKISERINMPMMKGSWAQIINSSNSIIGDLVNPTNEMVRIIGAVAKGDLTQSLELEYEGVKLQGQFLRSAQIVNTMVEQLNSFSAEVTRVAREVGTEGKLGGQADVKGVSGTWKDLTDSVNGMASNLTSQVRNIAEVTTAVANGDLSKKITVEAKGEILELKSTINTMVEQLSSFGAEVTRVALEVGTEGKLGGQAKVKGVSGTWKDLTDGVNSMATNLTNQVRNIAEVTTAVANGDLSKKITVEAKGEILELKDTINTMVEQLSSFGAEVTRVALEVGTEGKLGGQAKVKGVSGTWRDLTESVNGMASNLTSQVRNIAQVTTAVAKGELTKKITVEAKGEILELKSTINTMVEQLSSFADEVTRVSREVGTEGKLGGQAKVEGVSGTWKDLTDSVNGMASNLTGQVRNIAEVTTAVANGDLSKKITAEAKGEILELKSTINTMVEQLSSFAEEVTRVALEVGTEGKLGGQADVKGVSGTWKDLTDGVNSMADNLTGQVRNIAEVTTAVAFGDLSKKITAEAKGEILELKNTINIMVEQLSSFADEVTRVSLEVGTEGKLGGQAQVEGVSGTWKDLTESVNGMAANLTGQVRNIAEVTTAVAKGELTKKITVEAKGEILELKSTINTMVEQLSSFADEVTRVAREVGTEGKLGGQADVKGVSGTWKDLTDGVNSMASNLTSQVRNIAEVTTAVANGNLAKKITAEAKGEILELKETINTMVEQLRSFASEVTRVSREVGTEGKLGGQAYVEGVGGTWKDLTDSVNGMASNLTNQVRNIALVTGAVAKGDLGKKITVDAKGEIFDLKNTINTMVDQLNSFSAEVTRVAREVGTEGKLGGQAEVIGVSGTWKDLTENVNLMATNLTNQVRGIAKVVTAVANGDLSRKLSVEAKGEIGELSDTINNMTDTLALFAEQVTGVARNVGIEGKLGGQANVPGAAGTWKDLTGNVNGLAANLTSQVRNIAEVTTAVAKGDLTKKITVEAKGEILELKNTINTMVDQLSSFGSEVTRVALEVGTEGKLGGQAEVKGVSGTWKNLTESVNGMARNLTNQVRAIADVATSVTKGDLTRSVQVEAKGEVADLKDNVNEMIRNLRETTKENSDQDWLKTNLAKFTRLLQGQRDLVAVSNLVLSELAPLINGQHGVFYIMDDMQEGNQRLKLLSSYAFHERKNLSREWKIGEGIVGQCAVEKQRILLTNVPSDYIEITSGLGESKPQNIIVMPILFENKVKAVIELASFTLFSKIHQIFLDQLAESIGIVLNTIEASMRTEELLRQSQSMGEELQSQQEELRNTNDELEVKAALLEEQKGEVEMKNLEVEAARKAIQEKAEQLAITSKYKSEFLSNMSHELRTPLNSMLILAQQLADNQKHNLDEKQVEYAKTIQASGNDLLSLINEILDLSKIESGTVSLDVSDVEFDTIAEQTERTFRPLAENRGLAFDIELSPNLPGSINTDEKRLQQIIKNLLSNSFKFTDKGRVSVRIGAATSGWNMDNTKLNSASQVIAFSVIDTGIGIPEEKQKIIFEAFQQADGSTSRKYGGTGLGLSISREIAHLLGGELILASSKVGKGSTFVLFLPIEVFEDQHNNPNTRSFSVNMQKIDQELSTQTKANKVAEPKLTVKNTQISKIADDRENIEPGDTTLLIVEDDPKFSSILLDLAHEKGFKGIVTAFGNEAIELAQSIKPTAITLDLHLPDIDGWIVFDFLKSNPETRHIPVDIISADDERLRGLRSGAYEYIVKPVTADGIKKALSNVKKYAETDVKNLMVVDSNEESRKAIVDFMDSKDVNIKETSTGKEALLELGKNPYGCIVVDFDLQDMSALKLIESIQKNKTLSDIPIILYGTEELTQKEQEKIDKLVNSGIVKDAKSLEQMFDETSLFLHRVVENLPEDKKKILWSLYKSTNSLVGKKVLIVDDDVRNIFALTSILESSDMQVVSAENGKLAIKELDKNPDIDIVLMDIMMPEMDGYETMRAIRKDKRFSTLPIIALTAKAMKGDREKCIEAGASDYISKPVSTDKLKSLMQVWLYKKA